MTAQAESPEERFMGWPAAGRPEARVRLRDRQERVVSAASPVLEQEGRITPTEAFYVVQHFRVPEPVRREDWRLTVDGHVRQPLTLAFDDLRTLQGRTVRALLECSGNDAAFFDVEPAGNAPAVFEPLPAGRERPRRADGLLLSAGEFTGVPLAAVLEQAGLGPNAVSVRVEGWDRGSPNPAGHGLPESYAGIPPFNYDKGLPLEKALHPDTLLAWAMNGQYLDHIHGAPLRLVVPGWSGNWSVKWVQRIEVLDRPATCWYQTEYYYFSASPDDPAREMITALPVKSLLTEPDDGATLPRGRRLLRGLAWSGAGTVTGVEVSADGGRTWRAARLEEPRERWLWVRWSLPWDFDQPGTYTILCRASDEVGRAQPHEPRRNWLRKNFNGIVPVTITIAG